MIYLGFLSLALLRIVLVLVAVAYFTLAERKIMASIQRRRGPNVVGLFGLLQPLADGLKLLCKEMVIPGRANPIIFLAAPLVIIILSLVSWVVVPFYASYEIPFSSLSNDLTIPRFSFYPLADINLSILFVLAISSLNVYGIIIAGWASRSKYAFFGALRSAAQMISYEVSIGLTILPVILMAGASNFTEIVLVQHTTVWFSLPLLPCAIVFFVSMLAETNRAPFDLPEAEAELVAGYNVEYGSMIFAMFFLGEYSNMLLMSVLITDLFFGGWMAPDLLFLRDMAAWYPFWIGFKVAIFCFLYVLVRATLPRYRYDQLMDIGWKIFLPVTLLLFIIVPIILLFFGSAPYAFEIDWSSL